MLKKCILSIFYALQRYFYRSSKLKNHSSKDRVMLSNF